jgi:hypothetical protein
MLVRPAAALRDDDAVRTDALRSAEDRASCEVADSSQWITKAVARSAASARITPRCNTPALRRRRYALVGLVTLIASSLRGRLNATAALRARFPGDVASA